ncbi:MAG TPA: DUF3306 domain-containing protein [Hyphomicrobiaceae bacterium]|jgi:hypothetical protein
MWGSSKRKIRSRAVNRPKSALAALLLTIVAAAPAVAEQASFTPAAAVAEGRLSAGHPASLVDIGSLTIDSDFTVFMRKDVPEDVRRIALRKLWTLMELPQSCMELCIEPEPASAAGLVAAAGK